MKRRDLIRELEKIAKARGATIEFKEGGKHTKVTIGRWSEPIPRHREINELLAKAILRRANNDADRS